MGRSVYIAGLGPGGGKKSTIALGLTELLSRQTPRVGVFRPLVATRDRPDAILSLLHGRYRLDRPYEELFGTTFAEASALVAAGNREELISRVVDRYRALERHFDAIVVIGSDFDDNGEPARVSPASSRSTCGWPPSSAAW